MQILSIENKKKFNSIIIIILYRINNIVKIIDNKTRRLRKIIKIVKKYINKKWI